MKAEIYFEVKTLKDGGAYSILKVVPEALIPTILKCRKNNESVLVVKDNFGQVHTADEMIAIFKESVEADFEDVRSMKEALKRGTSYFKELFEKEIISEEEYEQYKAKMEQIKKEASWTTRKKDFIAKIVNLYIQ